MEQFKTSLPASPWMLLRGCSLPMGMAASGLHPSLLLPVLGPGQESHDHPPPGAVIAPTPEPFGCFRPSSSLNEKKDLKFTASIDVESPRLPNGRCPTGIKP